jgi:cystathionine beta-lyase/cystathionine gamma-synthase
MKDWTEILLHLGEDTSFNSKPIVPPIVQSSNFGFGSVAEFRAAFQNEQAAHLYTRGNNPTVEIVRKKIAALEGSEDALLFASGSAAIAAAIMGQVASGDHVVCVQKPYNWTYILLQDYLARFQVTVTFVDGRNLAEIAQAIQPNTKVLMLESPNSLTFELQDLKACAALAQQHGLVSIIDNSYCSPLYQNPIDYGIDLVIHSGTKYLGGHSDVVFGVVCGSKALIKPLFHAEFMTLGACLSPHDAWLILRSLRTLPLRMRQISATTQQVTAFLKQHPKVDYILYPLDESFPQYELAQSQMRGAGGLFSVNYKGKSIEQMEKFCDALSRIFQMAVSWGGHEALQIPTCTFYNIEGKTPPPLPFTFVRYYIGLEEPEYLIKHLDNALKIL